MTVIHCTIIFTYCIGNKCQWLLRFLLRILPYNTNAASTRWGVCSWRWSEVNYCWLHGSIFVSVKNISKTKVKNSHCTHNHIIHVGANLLMFMVGIKYNNKDCPNRRRADTISHTEKTKPNQCLTMNCPYPAKQNLLFWRMKHVQCTILPWMHVTPCISKRILE